MSTGWSNSSYRHTEMTLTESYFPAQAEDVELLDSTCGGALRDAVAAVPDRIALIEGIPDASSRRRWTYAELLRDSEQAARALLTRFQPGDHVAVWAANCPEWVILQFGLSLAGMVLVTVNPAYRSAELKYVLEQSRAKGVLYQENYRGVSMADVVTEVSAELPELEHRIVFDDLPDFFASADANVELPTVECNDPVMIQYTSGTTGFPKGAHLHHHGVTNNSRIVALTRGAGTGTVDISAMPLFHTGGCVVSVLGTLQTHGTLILVSEFEPNLFLDLVEKERVQYTLCVPTMLIALLEAMAGNRRDMSSMEAVISGGATVPVELVNRIEAEMGVQFSIVFGQTECSPLITMVRLDDVAKDKSESLGRALPHTEVKIIDPETGATLPVGQTGELCTRGYLVMNGYFEMPEATARTIDEDRWLHTGDLCSMDDRGYCYVEGRLKEMIICGGENIYPREIEELLFNHPAVAEVAVVGIPDERWGEQVAAFLRPAEGKVCSADQLHDFMREHLAPHKTPKIWVSVDQFPMTLSGKIQKFQLAKMFANGELKPNI